MSAAEVNTMDPSAVPRTGLSRRRFASLACGVAAVAAGGGAFAQGDARVARVLVGSQAGGVADAIARIFVSRLRGAFPGDVIVDNRPGAGGRLAVEALRSARPDGSTLLFTADFVLTVYPHSYRKLPYDPLRDFAPIAAPVRTALVLSAGPALPASVKTLTDFLRWCRAHPQQAAYASPGAGSTAHFAGFMLAKAAGVELTHVPYKGGAPALQDLLGGQIPVSFNPVGEVLPYLQSGKLRVLATTGARRSRLLPQAPTLAEAGFPGIVIEPWLGFLAPAGTPEAVVARLSAAIGDLARQADVAEALDRQGLDVVASTPASLASQIRSDLDLWAPVVKASGFTAED
ncbi:Bug family tripartite tricarboxylate transporter substrate binding protein [Paracidovorax wautersii]|jgi:tripartite-type tricarboxylate transporter receptor subunit TctC|uniref:Tripartite-type tricarboxylate transporter, receptor component TctC n=1 Tax=Paracidovorax wautersii TaxID=1177982 RepID=A0A1I2DYW3_9BURK|nr:tripartite tricarboxylate transporter substrate-binding protein [Paracidovorax wautersii]SFE85577.1 Tripartite-type tricarboxylate transporter, receptor component TctC [Paracidovorax wautersii]